MTKGLRDVQARQAERRKEITELTDEAEYVHALLIATWLAGNRNKELSEWDTEVRAKLEEAERQYELGRRVEAHLLVKT